MSNPLVGKRKTRAFKKPPFNKIIFGKKFERKKKKKKKKKTNKAKIKESGFA